MKTKQAHLISALSLLAFLTINHQLSTAFAQGTAFTYQGRLNSGGGPANGFYDFRFKLYADPLGSTQVGSGYMTNGIPVTNGLFVTTIDFGAAIFTGGTNWLEIDVRTNGAASYTVLNPLQGITPTPDAIFATTAGNVSGTVPAAQIGGTILNSSLPASPNFSGTVTANQISGNGANVTNVNAALLNGKAATNFWQTGGNAGTSPANGNFLGTTDNQPLELRVNNSRALRIEPNVSAAPNFLAGAPVNFAAPGVVGAVIGGGGATNYFGTAYTNSVASDFGIIAGGTANQIQAGTANSMIGGGYGNTIQANSQDSFIGAGISDVIQPNAPGSVIGGGYINVIGTNADHSVIGGGYVNALQPNATDSVIGGGNFNLIQANATGAFIGGGYNNVIATNADHGVVGGGWQNQVQPNAYESVIAGGESNVVGPNAQWSAIGGGENNTNGSPYSVIGGGIYNLVQLGSGSVIAGGYDNLISSNTYQVAIGGGRANQILPSDFHSVIGGGAFNLIQNFANDSVIGGGYQNAINLSANNGFIGGGYLNTIQSNATYSTIGGGLSNLVSGAYGTVPGGAYNVAGGQYSFAAGQQAQALHNGAFVWADSQAAPFASTGINQFAVRAKGGVSFQTAGAGMTLDGQTVFAGNNGAALANVNAATLNGLASGSFAPAGGSANYIQNQSAVAQSASLNISGSATVGNASVNGSITAPMWKATNVVNTAGPLAVTQTFTSSGGTLVVSAAGTGYSTTAGAVIGMDVYVDATKIDSCLIYANPSLTHMAFLPKTIVRTGVAAGLHTLQLVAHGSTATDATDTYCVTVQELPF